MKISQNKGKAIIENVQPSDNSKSTSTNKVIKVKIPKKIIFKTSNFQKNSRWTKQGSPKKEGYAKQASPEKERWTKQGG